MGSSVTEDPISTGKPALTSPPDNLQAFPSVNLFENRIVARSHKVTYHPWWFASSPTEGGGRFDLADPRGTCYVADTIDAAVRERLREKILTRQPISTRLADSFAVSLFAMPRSFRCAHIGLRRAALFGVTRELESLPPRYYPLSREWAEAFAQADFEGIRYGVRFTPGRPNAWALFERAGGEVLPKPSVNLVIDGRDACRRSGIVVQDIPRSTALKNDTRASLR